VVSVSRNPREWIHVSLATKPNRAFGRVFCSLADTGAYGGPRKEAHEQRAAKLKKGDKLTLRGKVLGRETLEVAIVDCEFVNEETEQATRDQSVYRNPFVVHLRKALDNYSQGSTAGIEEGAELASFDRAYYRSKFYVLGIGDTMYGGKNIEVVFLDKPDKVFSAWVYKYAALPNEKHEYALRGFGEISLTDSQRQNVDERVTTARKISGSSL
jgi:hypothetical protein